MIAAPRIILLFFMSEVLWLFPDSSATYPRHLQTLPPTPHTRFYPLSHPGLVLCILVSQKHHSRPNTLNITDASAQTSFLRNHQSYGQLNLPVHNYLLKSYNLENNNDRESLHGQCVQKIWLICCYPNIVSLSLTWHAHPPITRCLSGASVSDSCFRCQNTAIPLLSMDVHQ